MMGIGGGIVSEESRKKLDMAELLFRQKKPKKAMPYLMDAIEGGNNLDAVIQMSQLVDLESGLEMLEAAERRGRRFLQDTLGKDCFEDGSDIVGKFWLILPTRPYMRVLKFLVEVYYHLQRYEESTKVILEMLRLCPGDNMGMRTWTGPLLLRCGRYGDALSFCQQWLTDKTITTGLPPERGGIDFTKPHRNTMAVKKEKKHSSTDCSILHCAALASFKHFGDYEQSRQYLRMAAKNNPIILLKVLGNIKRPVNLNNGIRSFNGPEDAQDYLWLAQDFWMEKEVWKWANDNPDVKDVVLKVCSRPECTTREVRVAEYKQCAACHLVSYCSVKCQKDDWTRHKPECLKQQKFKQSKRAFQHGKGPSNGNISMALADMLQV